MDVSSRHPAGTFEGGRFAQHLRDTDMVTLRAELEENEAETKALRSAIEAEQRINDATRRLSLTTCWNAEQRAADGEQIGWRLYQTSTADPVHPMWVGDPEFVESYVVGDWLYSDKTEADLAADRFHDAANMDTARGVLGEHRWNRDVHYRLYDTGERGVVVICVQDFDYPDYDEDSFVSTQAWDSEQQAEEVLSMLRHHGRV